MASLLLDTHIALWLDSGSERLKKATRARIDRCWRDGGNILLSAVSVWEIALLVDMKRIELDVPVSEWVNRFLERPGFEAVPLNHGAAARAYGLEPFPHRDPADRLIVATAILVEAPLITYDERILGFARRYGRRHGFAAQM